MFAATSSICFTRRMNQQSYYRVSVKGIVIDKAGRILLSLEDDGKWSMLGGGLEHKEDPIDGLKREVYEETGLAVTYTSKAPIYFFTVPKRVTGRFAAIIVYEIRLDSMDFTPSEECQQLQFFTIEEMHKIPLTPSTQKLLEIIKK